MKFIADLHIHSHFSRATAKNLNLESLYMAARTKGINVVGTGDFTHPGWLAELKEKLEPVEPGLFCLKKEITDILDKKIPPSCKGDVRFMLTVEISSIYKKDGKTRKNHNVIFAPNLEVVEKFDSKLDRIGNIKSDGRPILGLDVMNLLEILLETSEDAFLVPAHIWTPWFSTLGSKSGFDSLKECFEDLTPYIFAVETGLSSDPPMNWRVSFLDNLTLISNSDAHSPDKLGREANLFDTELSYYAMKDAMKTGNGFSGTIEFYPEEGKYHFDGHRKCNVRLSPAETIKYNGLCPECGKPLTLGVLYRIEQLADRFDGKKPKRAKNFHSLIPLKEILSEILKVGPKSKKVLKHYEELIGKLGSEFSILKDLSIDEINAGMPVLGEAVKRMREGKVILNGGFDGEFGTTQIFTPGEIEKLMGQTSLFKTQSTNKRHVKKKTSIQKISSNKTTSKSKFTTKNLRQDQRATNALNKQQLKAVKCTGKPILIVAGPGTGKTRTLTYRIAYLITEKGILPENILAVTFTQKAANEMRERLTDLLKNKQLPFIATFHGLCLEILKKEFEFNNKTTILDEDSQDQFIKLAISRVKEHGGNITLKSKKDFASLIASAKQKMIGPDEDFKCVSNLEFGSEILRKFFADVYLSYGEILKENNLLDYEDLIFNTVRLFESNSDICKKWQQRFISISVDEYQDLNFAQYYLVRLLAPSSKDLCVIGDPDQSIYGFRGSDTRYFQKFTEDYPDASVIRLSRNYRSTDTILDASNQIIKKHRLQGSEDKIYSGIQGDTKIHFLKLKTEKAEAEAVVKTIENLVGGITHFSIDSNRVDAYAKSKEMSFSDFAVLYRISEQAKALEQAFERSGIPYQTSGKNKWQKKLITKLVNRLKVIEGIAVPENGSINQKELYDLKQCSENKQIMSMTVSEKLNYIIKLPEFSKLNNNEKSFLNQILILSSGFENDSFTFLANIALQREVDMIDPRAEKVNLLTMHGAKGLEFPVVFITGCENDLTPFRRSEKDNPDIDEERRLFYVAMTRAQDILYLSRAEKRLVFGKIKSQSPSPFLKDVEETLRMNEQVFSHKKNKLPQQVQMNLF
ncbi:DNA helicase II / ATP-dependent DNA helicase PcrA [Candidatus Magnetomoraceae bacterium gMMP-15]